jgi:hypothetical protein
VHTKAEGCGLYAPSEEEKKEKQEKEEARKEQADIDAAVLQERKKGINIERLTYQIIDTDEGDYPSAKKVTIQIIDGVYIIGEWSIMFYLNGTSSEGRGAGRMFYRKADLGQSVLINEAYQGLGLSRFMGYILAHMIEILINNEKLSKKDIFFMSGDAGQGFWQSLGMQSLETRQLPENSDFDWKPGRGDDEKWMFVEEYMEWARNPKKAESIVVLRTNLEKIAPRQERTLVTQWYPGTFRSGGYKFKKRKSRKKKKRTRRKRCKSRRKKNRKKRTKRRKSRRRKYKKK